MTEATKTQHLMK